MSLERCVRCNQWHNPGDLLYGRCPACRAWCRMPGCRGKHRARGYCSPHYNTIYRRGGQLRRIRPSASTAEEAAFLASCGYRLAAIETQLYPESPSARDSLYRALHRAERDDLWRRLKEAA